MIAVHVGRSVVDRDAGRVVGSSHSKAHQRPILYTLHQSQYITLYATYYNTGSGAVCFYARQLYRKVLLRARISYGNSVRLSVCQSRPGGIPSPGDIETPGLHHMIA